MRHVCSFLVLAASISATGCGQSGWGGASSPRGGTAVVDLDKVASETGRDRQLAQSLEMAQNSLNQSYANTVESAKKQLSDKKKEYGDNLTDSEKKEYMQYEQNAAVKLNQIKNKAQIDFEAYKQKQITQFRGELKPIAQEIASKRGLSIVIPKNEGLLLSVDPGVDITDEVIKVLREKHPVNTTPAAPAAEATTSAAPRSNAQRRAAAPARTAASSDQNDDEDTAR